MTPEQTTFDNMDTTSKVELRDVTEHIVDSEHKSAPESEEGYPLIKTSDIENGHINFETVAYVDEEAYNEWTRRLKPESGDIIMTREAPVGRVGLVPEGRKVCLGQRTVLIRTDSSKLDNQFLRYLLLSEDVQNRFDALSSGSTVDHLNLSDLRGFELPSLPDIEEQKTIGQILGNIDEKIDLNRKIIRNVESLIQTIYTSWFVNYDKYSDFKETEMGKIPTGFEVQDLTDIVDVVYGYAFDSDNFNQQNQGYPVIRNGDLPNENIDYSTNKYIDIDFDSKYEVNPGDLVITMDGEFRPHIWKGNKAALNQRVCMFKGSSEEYSNIFLQHLISQPLFELEQTKTGTTVIHLGKRDIRDIQVPVPDTQSLIEFNSLISPFYEKITELSKEIRCLLNLREALTPKLISGEIRVNDINVEDLEVSSEV